MSFLDHKESIMLSITILVILLAAGALTWFIKAQERRERRERGEQQYPPLCQNPFFA